MKNQFVKKSELSPGRKKGQAMVEFMLVLPLLMLVLVGILEFSRLFFAWIIIENSTRFGVRYATTGGYDPQYCTDLDGNSTPCGDASEDEEVDIARIPSIKDETRRIIIGFQYLDQDKVPGITNVDNEYLHVTVCSAKDDRTFTPPLMARPVYANCTLPDGTYSENAADPGQRVVVATDYNFTFMVLPIFGIEPSMIHLASYREGIVELFRATRAINTPIPLKVPTAIVTPSPTSTITDTPTITPSPTVTSTPTITPSPTDTPTDTPSPTSTSTPTSTATFTPTSTPVPSCANISINRTRFNGDNFEARVVNKNFAPAYLISSTLSWSPSPLTGGRYFDLADFGGTYYDPPNTPNTSSPITTSSTPPALPIAGNSAQLSWIADFSDSNFSGTYNITLVFNFPNWGNCTLTGTVNNFTPTPTLTRTPTNTPTITRTPTITLTPSKTPSPTITRTPSNTPPPTNTRTPSKTPTRTNTPTITNTPPNTSTRTSTPTASKTPTKTNTPTNTVLPPTPTRTPTKTPTPTTTFCADC